MNIVLNFSKALVILNFLVSKLDNTDIKEMSLKWLKSYLILKCLTEMYKFSNMVTD